MAPVDPDPECHVIDIAREDAVAGQPHRFECASAVRNRAVARRPQTEFEGGVHRRERDVDPAYVDRRVRPCRNREAHHVVATDIVGLEGEAPVREALGRDPSLAVDGAGIEPPRDLGLVGVGMEYPNQVDDGVDDAGRGLADLVRVEDDGVPLLVGGRPLVDAAGAGRNLGGVVLIAVEDEPRGVGVDHDFAVDGEETGRVAAAGVDAGVVGRDVVPARRLDDLVDEGVRAGREAEEGVEHVGSIHVVDGVLDQIDLPGELVGPVVRILTVADEFARQPRFLLDVVEVLGGLEQVHRQAGVAELLDRPRVLDGVGCEHEIRIERDGPFDRRVVGSRSDRRLLVRAGEVVGERRDADHLVPRVDFVHRLCRTGVQRHYRVRILGYRDRRPRRVRPRDGERTVLVGRHGADARRSERRGDDQHDENPPCRVHARSDRLWKYKFT